MMGLMAPYGTDHVFSVEVVLKCKNAAKRASAIQKALNKFIDEFPMIPIKDMWSPKVSHSSNEVILGTKVALQDRSTPSQFKEKLSQEIQQAMESYEQFA